MKKKSVIAGSYSDYVSSWLDENLNLLDFYTKADVVNAFSSYDEIGEWLATTPERRSSELDYVLFISAEGNSYYNSGFCCKRQENRHVRRRKAYR